MKALLLSQIYPSDWEPTRGPFNLNVFRALAGYCDVRVVAPRPWWIRLRRAGELVRIPQATVEGLPSAYPTYWSIPGAHALHAGGMNFSLGPHIRALRWEFPFDVVLGAWMYPDAVAAARIADRYSCPLVIKILGSDINVLPTMPGLKRPIQWALSRADRVVTVSGALRERVIDLGVAPERVVVQHNGVDGQRFTLCDKNQARASLGIDTDRPTICYVGRLGEEKGIDILIEALAILKQKGRGDIRLYLVGHGKEEEALRAQAARTGVEDMVVFCGMQLHSAVPNWIAACDVLCLPSRREGCPNVVLEALASGRPVVAAGVGGVPEILAQSSGEIVEPENPAALANGLERALNRSWDSQSLRASVECLSWDDVGRNYYRHLADVLDERRRTTPSAVPAGAR